jgi:hypothetical protein
MPTESPKVVADDYLQRIVMRQKNIVEVPAGLERAAFKSLEKAL